jgi:hypothetical protein
MKKIFLFVCMLSSVTFLKAQTADDIINKYVEAMGGKDKLIALNTVYMEGSMDANGQKISLKDWCINNKAMRSEMEFNGMTMYQVVTNDSGWSYNPMMSSKSGEPMTPEEVKISQSDLDLQGTLVNYKQKGYTVTYVGKDDVDGTEAYKLEEKISDNLTITFYIDPNTYYVLRTSEKAKVNGKEVENKSDYSNYQKTPEGYVFPMEISGGGGDMKFTLIKVNPDVDGKLFTKAK